VEGGGAVAIDASRFASQSTEVHDCSLIPVEGFLSDDCPLLRLYVATESEHKLASSSKVPLATEPLGAAS